jgi:hypothetical protein
VRPDLAIIDMPDAADALELTADQLARLVAVPAPIDDRYADMTPVNR